MMKQRPLFFATACIMFGFGSGFLLMPAFVLSLYGVTLDAHGVHIFRMFGAAVTALGVLAAVSETSDRKSNIIFLTFFTLKSLVSLLALLDGMFNPLGWTILLIDVPMALLHGATLLKNTAPVHKQESIQPTEA